MVRKILRMDRGDEGGALLLVLVVAILVIATLGVTFSLVESGLTYTNLASTSSQSEMAAQSGLATEVTAMESDSSYSQFPCSASGALGVTKATWSVSVAYSANGTALSCNGSSSTLGTDSGSEAPTDATLTSTGKAPHGTTVVMKQDLEIAVTQADPAEVGYAIFSSSNIVLQGTATLTTGTDPPNLYAGNTLTCENSTTSTGSVITYEPVDFSGSCEFDGNLVSAGYVELQNSATIKGNVTSYGGNTSSTSCGSTSSGKGSSKTYTYYAICLSGGVKIDGNATEADGNIDVPNGTIVGNADASGTITVSGGGAIDGTQTANDATLASDTMPAADNFPSSPTTVAEDSSGWTVVDIPNSSYTCAQYFQSIDDEAGSSNGQPSVSIPDPFQSALESQSSKTIYYAPSCDVSYTNAQVFALNPTGGDAILDVATLSFSNSNTFCEESSENSHVCSSSTSPGPNLILEADGNPPAPPATYSCSPSTVDATFNNSTDFEQNVSALIYSLGEVEYANDSVMQGEVLACGGFQGTNTFSMKFNNSAASEVYGGASGEITITVIDKYIASG